MPLLAQAYGNLFLPALLLVFGLGAMLYSAGRRNVMVQREMEKPGSGDKVD